MKILDQMKEAVDNSNSLRLIERLEVESYNNQLASLARKEHEQQKEVKKKLREQNMCFTEFICNIDELEQLSQKKVDPSFIHLLNVQGMIEAESASPSNLKAVKEQIIAKELKIRTN